MSSFVSSLLAIALASTAYSSPLSTSSHYAPLQRSPLAVAPLFESEHGHGAINNSYIVVLKDDLPPSLMDNHLNFLATAHQADPLVDALSGVQQVYTSHIRGYSGRFTDGVVELLRNMPEVDFIERDQIVRTTEIKVSNVATQKSAPWGLARISHRPRLSFGTFTKYEYDSEGGDGVDVYVIDTGINVNHVEFEGRAAWGYTVPQNDVDEDGNGHGSHCAGTIASRKFGVAKKANVIAVKVLGSNGSGSMSDVVKGVDWAASQAKAKATAADAEFKATGKTKHKGSVANMSLGGGKSQALDSVVNKAVDGGLHFAVAAGNEDKDACSSSPAAAEKAVTVGASTLTDERAYFSNKGPCVDIFAPGLNIVSTYKGSNTSQATLSGTSMASPHIAGVLAYYLSIYPSATFNPVLKKDFVPASLESQRPLSSSSFYSVAHAALPGFITQFLPSVKLVEAVTAPVPDRPTISPLQLKAAIIALSSEGLLTDIPSDTVNKLVFNNATTS